MILIQTRESKQKINLQRNTTVLAMVNSCCEYSRLVFSSATDLTTSSIRVFTEDRSDSNMVLNIPILSSICIISLNVAIDTNSAAGSKCRPVGGFEDLEFRV